MQGDPVIQASRGKMAGSISRHGVSVLRDAVHHRQLLVDNEEYERRLKICEECEELRSDKRCAVCGCFTTVKAKFKRGLCPVGKYES